MKSTDGSASINVSANGNGQMAGTVVFQDVNYAVTGEWAAADSVPGRNYSAFFLGGSDDQTAPEFIAVGGTMKGPGSAPVSISMNLIRTDSTDGLQYGWSGEMVPA
ncbi:hypothetical protein FGU71_08365 [Erythrobacter insulae]|uniref:Uncharacterized protein n=1 Tax=Erythrobacter insulae TaxID=2584124 RepID=A0A547PCL2_9SPHN|nr:hypothetical protein [Erythrobacter insulae]TRD11865.1 hypothetical protein FGU71_08365 [Erythrobacter insulae]